LPTSSVPWAGRQTGVDQALDRGPVDAEPGEGADRDVLVALGEQAQQVVGPLLELVLEQRRRRHPVEDLVGAVLRPRARDLTVR